MPVALILSYIIPLVLKIVDHLTPAEADEVKQKLNEAIDRRKAAVARNDALDAPREL